jgi:hypothetical protein
MTLRNLTAKFSSLREADAMTPEDRRLWDYFAGLYKNSNKGIKGRGKDRKISCPANKSALRNTDAEARDGPLPSGSDDDDSNYSDDEDHGHFYPKREQ